VRLSSLVALVSLVTPALLLARPTAAHATTWPDVEERVARDLDSNDVLARRAAAHALEKIRGEAALPLVRNALDDPDPEVKLAGAEVAARLQVAGAVDQVLPWLGDREARVRVAACEVLRANPDAKAVAPLGRALGDGDAQVRAAAAEALGAAAADDAVPALLSHLDDSTPLVRIAVIRALSRRGDPRAVTPLIGKIQDSAPEVRQAVARALGESGELRTSPALVLLLRDANHDVRAEALRSLARLRAASAVDPIAALLGDRSAWAREEAAAALGRIATPDAVRRLVTALATEEPSALSGAPAATPVREALVRAGAVADEPLAAALDRSSSPTVSAGAAWVFGERRERAQARRIVAAFRRGSLPAADALHALAGAGGPEELPVVLESLADPNPVVRDEALAAAAHLLDPAHPDGRAVEPLAAVLNSPRPRLSSVERAKVADLLGRTGAPRAVPLLVPLTRAADAETRIEAIDALGTLGFAPALSADVDGALLHAIVDTDARTRLHAAAAIARAGGDRARQRLVAALDSGEEVDRAALTTALGGLLARRPDDAATRAVVAAFDLSGGADRDAFLVVLGRLGAGAPQVNERLTRLAREGGDDDRRSVATVLPLRPADARASSVSLATGLLGDPDPRVRAQAAWALGELGDAGASSALEKHLGDPDPAVVANGAIAVARLAGRGPGAAGVSRALCPLLGRDNPFVRANALTGLRWLGARCGTGDVERGLVVNDPSEEVRLAAARLLAAGSPSGADGRALGHCAASDPSPAVALACDPSDEAAPRAPAPVAPPAPAGSVASAAPVAALTVYVIPATHEEPQRLAPYVASFSDGALRVGVADRRGAFVEAHPPSGPVTLRPVTLDPSAARPSRQP
jgi:HEAT repeat protein